MFFIDFHWFSLIFNVFHWFSWIFIDFSLIFHWFSLIFIDFQWCSLSFMDFQWFLLIFVEFFRWFFSLIFHWFFPLIFHWLSLCQLSSCTVLYHIVLSWCVSVELRICSCKHSTIWAQALAVVSKRGWSEACVAAPSQVSAYIHHGAVHYIHHCAESCNATGA